MGNNNYQKKKKVKRNRKKKTFKKTRKKKVKKVKEGKEKGIKIRTKICLASINTSTYKMASDYIYKEKENTRMEYR